MVVVPARNGWAWIRAGYRLFRTSPMLWILLVFAYWILISAIGVLPYVGIVVGLVVVPIFSVSFMNVARTAERGEPLQFSLLVSGFKTELRSLLVLGAIYFFALVAILALTQLIDGGILMRRMLLGASIPDEAFAEPALGHAVLLALTLYAPVMAAFWFAPVLVAWRGMRPAKSLFFSFFACFANWRAFLVYGISLGLVVGVIPGLLLTALAALFQPAQSALTLLPMMAAALFAAFVPMIFASYYVGYRDIFPPESTDLPVPSNPTIG